MSTITPPSSVRASLDDSAMRRFSCAAACIRSGSEHQLSAVISDQVTLLMKSLSKTRCRCWRASSRKINFFRPAANPRWPQVVPFQLSVKTLTERCATIGFCSRFAVPERSTRNGPPHFCHSCNEMIPNEFGLARKYKEFSWFVSKSLTKVASVAKPSIPLPALP